MFLALILITNILIINKTTSTKTYGYDKGLAIDLKPPTIYLYETEDGLKAINGIDNTLDSVSFYACESFDCKVMGINENNNTVIIEDDRYLLFDYINNTYKELDIPVDNYEVMNYVDNYVYIKKNGKYSIYSIKDNKFLTDFVYDGIKDNIPDYTVGLYTNNSKYNQTLDLFNTEGTIVKHYNHCTRIDTSDELLCSEHIEGKLTNQEVDNVIDTVLSQYPDLNNKRLFLIKSGIETVGLPYLWGGGHGTLENTLTIANRDWNIKPVYLSNGFKRQVAGQYYPSGLDCAGFVRWVYYIASGVDLYKDHVNVISGRNKDVTLIDHKDLLPGDIILDKDHVVIYLYKDENGKDISVHAAFDKLQVQISNYSKGNTYYRLNEWL